MGLLDMFKKKSPEMKNEIQKPQKEYEIEYSTTKDGRLQIDFYDNKIKVGQLYDSTRLVVGNRPVVLANQAVQNCLVSWYNRDDAVFVGEGESLSAKEYKGVLAQIDLALLEADEKYCVTVMKNLLEQNRVNKYLEEGLKENPERPCGKYIGGVKETEEGYKKIFSMIVGQASHNSELMVNCRRELRESIEAKKQAEIAKRKAQIQKLQSEIDDMSR